MNQILKRKKIRKRSPGKYPDVYSMKKEENNTLILHSCKLLEAYYNNEQGITAFNIRCKRNENHKSFNAVGLNFKRINNC